MKSLNLMRITRFSVLTLALTLTGAFTIFAQNNQNNSNSARTEERRTETTRVVNQDNDTDWGWLGLLGLLGLAGLIPKKRSIEVKGVRDVNENRPAA